MANITEKEGVILLSGMFDMKIDNNRIVYVKKKNDTIYKKVEQLPQGLTSDDKKRYLYNFYNGVVKKLNESGEQQREQKEDINHKFY